MPQLNAFLEEILVKKIQTTKTGFATYPVSEDAQHKMVARTCKLEASLPISGQCKIEKPGQHGA